LDALREYRRRDRYGFTPPGHRQGRGIGAAVTEVVGAEPFRGDVLASSGLDDRRSRGGYLRSAEELMADAVCADNAFFSTCGSSLSVKAAMLAVAGDQPGGVLLGRDSHKSIVAGLVFSGVRPRWITRSGTPNDTCPIPRRPRRWTRRGGRTRTPPPY
jgi:arginine decarboxylase